jgi:hypothetical protein
MGDAPIAVISPGYGPTNHLIKVPTAELIAGPVNFNIRTSMGRRATNSKQETIRLLRDLLLALDATGDQGFEGFAAKLVGVHLGTTVRLSKSGSQHGRDAGAGPVALECKRYADKAPDTRMLLGNLTEAIQSTHPPEVWVLAATCPIPLQDAQILERTGQNQREDLRVNVIILDWHENDFPRFLALMIAYRKAARDWFETNVDTRTALDLDKNLMALMRLKEVKSIIRELNEIKLYGHALERLKQEIDKAYDHALRNAGPAKAIFGQRLPLLANERWLVERTELLKEIDEAVSGTSEATAILGNEGVGKTWVVVDYWRRHKSDHFLIFVSSQRMALGRGPSGQENILANAIVNALHTLPGSPAGLQDANRVHALLRANANRKDGIAFFTVFDGLNERPDAEWGNVLHRETRSLGNKSHIVFTCRPLSWSRNFQNGRQLDINLREVEIGPFNSRELEEALRKHGVDPAEVDPQMVGDLNNPRLFSLAVGLIKNLAGEPITRERIFWEYWRQQRQEHTGRQLTEAGFNRVLRSHANRCWKLVKDRSDPTLATFSYEDIGENSNFQGRVELLSELETVATTGFFRPTGQGSEPRYALAPDRLYYAMGLTLFLTLAECADGDRSEATEQLLADWIDPLADTDAAATILSAALLVACYQDNPRIELTEPLLSQLLSLRNRQGNLGIQPRLQVLTACSILFPQAFAAAAEKATAVDSWLVEPLSRGLRHNRSRDTITAAVHRWLSGREPILASLALQVLAGHNLDPFVLSLRKARDLVRDDADVASELDWLLALDEATPVPVTIERRASISVDDPDLSAEPEHEGLQRAVPSGLPGAHPAVTVLHTGDQLSQNADQLLDFEVSLVKTPAEGRMQQLKNAIRNFTPANVSNFDRSFVVDIEGVDLTQIVIWAKQEPAHAVTALRLLARVEPTVSEVAAEELVDFIVDPKFDESARVDACRIVSSSSGTTRAARRLFSSGWSAACEPQGQVALTASAILTTLVHEPGFYPTVRDRVVASALPDALASVAAEDSDLFVDDLNRLVSARIIQLNSPSAAAPMIASGTAPSYADAGHRPEFLSSLSNAGSIRLARLAPDTVQRWIDAYEREMRSASLNTEIRSFVISLLPGWSAHNRLHAAKTLEGMIRELTQSAPGAGRECGFSFVDFKSAVAMAGANLADPDRADRAIGAMIRSAGDDQTLSMIVHHVHELNRDDWLRSFCAQERTTGRPGRTARARMLEAMAGFESEPLLASPNSSEFRTEIDAQSIEGERARAINALLEWREDRGDRAASEKILIETAMHTSFEADLDAEGDVGRMLARRIESASVARRGVISDVFLNRPLPPLRLIVSNAVQSMSYAR